MRIAMAQINPTLGDFAENRKQIFSCIQRARQNECDLVVFPETSLFGYHPVDLLERAAVVDAQMKEFDRLVKQLPKGIAVLVGLFRHNPEKRGKPYYNSAALLVAGRKPKFFNKELLPTYDVFDDARHIERGDVADGVIELKGRRLLVTICEDIWAWDHPDFRNNYRTNPLAQMKSQKVDFVVNLSASPFAHNKLALREYMVKKTAQFFKAPLIYVNMVGGQDELIFDGGSFAVDKKGKEIAKCLHFQPDFQILDFETLEGVRKMKPKTALENTRAALVLGIRDFVRKSGFEKVHLGLSGGIDSAVVACLAAEALGPQNVQCIGLPGPYNAPESLVLAQKLAQNLGCYWLECPITSLFKEGQDVLSKVFPDERQESVVYENLQSRIRGLLLMAVSNHSGSLLLTTGNKDEYATGYATLYGDMCGGLAPIADLVKAEVYDLARLYNQQGEVIPERIITRPPSAELKPNQTDQDTLPPYDQLDLAVRRLVEKLASPRGEIENWVLKAMQRSEFKRWQAAPILKVSSHAFGRGRRWPIAHKAKA